MVRTRSVVVAAAALGAAELVAGAVIAGGALATPGAGVVTGTITYGVMAGHTVAKQDGVALLVAKDSTVTVTTITYAPGGFSGWHRHPGIVIATVESGSVYRQVGCKVERFDAGDSFTEVAPHYVSNVDADASDPAGVPAVLRVTQIYPADAPARRVDVDPPVCHRQAPRYDGQ